MPPAFNLPKRLPLVRASQGTEWLRIHSRTKSAIWFGPAAGYPPVNRFDDPDSQFKVCYLGTTIDICFAETFLRNPPVRILSLADLESRAVATIRTRRDLRLVPLHGPNLAKIGVTAEIASSTDYAHSQEISRRLWEHPDKPDGILYRARHDDSNICVCLFDRAKTAMRTVAESSLTQDLNQLSRLLVQYGLGLTN